MLHSHFIFNAASEILPKRIQTAVRTAAKNFDGNIYEIRLYANGGTTFTTCSGTKYVTECGVLSDNPGESLRPTAEETELAVMKAAGWSPFAHEDEIKRGYITFGCGIRMGFGGECSGTGTPTVRGVTSVNIRIPCVHGDSAPGLYDEYFSGIANGLLVAGEPGSGKTTFLKKAMRRLAEAGMRVCAVDERREFFGSCARGNSMPNIDIVSGGTKAAGIMRAVRLLSPEYVICDEIGTDGESEAVRKCLNSGVKFIASMHAGSLEQLIRREQFKTLFVEGIFDRVIFLDGTRPGRLMREYSFSEVKNAIRGTDFNMYADGSCRHPLCIGDEETRETVFTACGTFE